MGLTAEDRVRRTAILCEHCLRNIAFYRAGWYRQSKIRVTRQFWIGANGNFMDIAVLEWCKLFADTKAQHHWSKTIANPAAFMDGLLNRLRFTEEQFARYINSVKRPRDKFIAHLDQDHVMDFPVLRPARSAVAYLHDKLFEDIDTRQWFQRNEIRPASKIYPVFYRDAMFEYVEAAKR